MKTITVAYTFEGNSKPGKTYQTLIYADGSISCDCFGWCKRVQANGARTCTHVREIEMGTAERHAIAVKRYDTAPARQTPTAPAQARQLPLTPTRPIRALDLED